MAIGLGGGGCCCLAATAREAANLQVSLEHVLVSWTTRITATSQDSPNITKPLQPPAVRAIAALKPVADIIRRRSLVFSPDSQRCPSQQQLCLCRPAAEGGQPAQIGRKATGAFVAEFDRPQHRLQLRKATPVAPTAKTV